jgi:hypothetical protein
MRNIWKGLIIGGLTGMAGGALVDLVSGGAGKVADLGEAISAHAPQVIEKVRAGAADAANAVAGSDVPEQLRKAKQKIEQSGFVEQVKGAI